MFDRRISVSIMMMLFTVSEIASQNREYFQQEVNTVIQTKLDAYAGELHSSIRMQYINNSPDTLDHIYFHLWANAYSSNNTDLARQLFSFYGKQRLFRDEKQIGFIDSISFTANGSHIAEEYIKPDICRVALPLPLYPGDSVNIETPFRVKLPGSNISRMAAIDGIFNISQWYPKPAVYDKEGWHPMPYLDQGEFYSEYGSYDVYITIPANFVVGASGELVTESELEWLESYGSSWQPGHFIDEPSDSIKTLHFTAEHIHDFAWVAGTGFKMERDSITLPGSQRTVITQVMYSPDGAVLWANAMKMVKRSLLEFSGWIGDYPYDIFTAVQAPFAAGAGMEYPGLAIIGVAKDEYSLDEVIAHEVCHSWFYSALGSNERMYPFMDESLSSAMEERYLQKYYPGKKLWELYFRNSQFARFFGINDIPAQVIDELNWLIPAYQNIEQPFNLPAKRYTPANYSSMIYNKAAQSFNFLRAYLGDSIYDSVMHEYYARWKGRHPAPDDLEEAFRTAGKNLDWFFHDFLTTVKRTDYSIRKLQGDSIIIKNKGETAPPFKITVRKGNNASDFWTEGFPGTGKFYFPEKFEELIINSDHSMPEINLLNNNIRGKGLFRKSDPVRPGLLFTVYDPGERHVFLVPLINWNRADGFMAGLGLNNGILLSRKFEYSAMPFFTFSDPGFAGRIMLRYNYLPYDRLFRKVSFTAEGSRFGYFGDTDYHAFRTGIDIFFRNADISDPVSRKLSVYFINVSDIVHVADIQSGSQSFFTASFSAVKQSVVNPWSLRLTTEHASSFDKLLVQTNYRVSYYGRDNGLDLGFLAGGMIRNYHSGSMFSMAPAARSGRQLYLFEGDFPDRFSQGTGSFWSRQMLFREGGLVTAINDTTGYSPFLISLSAKSTLPGFAGKLPLRPFTNFVWQAQARQNYHWEAGISAGIPGFLEFYIPLVVSRDIYTIYPEIKDRIRFVFTLESFYRLRPSVQM